MVNWQSKKLGDFLWLANGLVLVVLINLLASNLFFRIDLTEEKRFSIKEPTKDLLRELDDNLYIEVFLEGELNSEFKRFRNSIEETLEEFRIYSGNKIQFTFSDPAAAMSQKAQSEFIQQLAQKGITPTNVIDRSEGQTEAKLIFPGALVSYGGVETGVMLLKGSQTGTAEEKINRSIEGVEFEVANAIYKLVNIDRKQIGFVTGHGELDSLDIASFNNALLELYDVFRVDLATSNSLFQYDALIIAKPQTAFSEPEKARLDQFIMNGGKALFMMDKIDADMNRVSDENYLALPRELNLDDQLFRYGVRVNYDLVQDRNAALYPVVTGESDGQPEMQLLEWPFFPLINQFADHAITRNMDAVKMRFVSSVDTVKAEGVTKIPLLVTSQYSRSVDAPVNVTVEDVFRNLREDDMAESGIVVGYLLEGKFTSLYQNRFLPEGVDKPSFKDKSVPTKIIVIADGDIVRNDVNQRTGQPQQLGFDPFVNYTFANQDLLMNAVAYLTDENGLINVRNKEVRIRPLDKQRAYAEKTKWQVVNLGVPLVIVVLYGLIHAFIRKRKFAKF